MCHGWSESKLPYLVQPRSCQLPNAQTKAKHAGLNVSSNSPLQNAMSRAESFARIFAEGESPPSGSGSRLGTAVIVVCGINISQLC